MVWQRLFLALSAVATLVFVASLPFSPISLKDKSLLAAFDLIVLLGIGILFWLQMRGAVRVVAVLFITIVLASSIIPMIFVFGTIGAPNTLGFFMAVPLAGLLLGRREMLIVVAIGMISVTLTYSLELAGIIASSTGHIATPETFVAILIGLGMNTALLVSTLRDTEHSAAEARTTAAQLASRNQELHISQTQLEAARDELEDRVAQRTAELDQANRQLRTEMEQRVQSEWRFRRLAERSPDFISILDLSSQTFTYTSKTELFGHPISGQTIQHDFRRWVHEDDLDVAASVVAQLLDQRRSVRSQPNFACAVQMVSGVGCRAARRCWIGMQRDKRCPCW